MIATTEDEAVLLAKYIEKLRPLVLLAQKAYGGKNQNSPAHDASRTYTALLREYREAGGSLVKLSKALNVSYSGIFRRVAMANGPAISNGVTRSEATADELSAAIARVRSAKLKGPKQYHAQLAHEYYDNKISLGALAIGLGIKNASPLYYGVQRHIKRTLDR